MIFNIDYRPWLAASNDATRPALEYVQITGDPNAEPDQNDMVAGIMAATNGFILAVVPVLLAPDDIAGLVHPGPLKQAAKLSKKLRLGEASVILAAKFITLQDRSQLPRYQDPNDANLNYPDWDPVVPDRIKPDKFQNILVAANVEPKYLSDTVAAIGCRLGSSGRGSGAGEHFPRLVFGAANDSGIMIEPMIVEPENSKIYKKYFPPFGLIMPRYQAVSNDNDPGNYWQQKTG